MTVKTANRPQIGPHPTPGTPARRWPVLALSLVWLLGCGADRGPSEQQLQARRLNNLGVVHMDQHNYSRGRDLFTEAVAAEPAYAVGYANLGIAYFSLGRYDSARVALEKALQHDGKHLHALYTLGLIHHAQGREYEQALEAFQAVAAADPDDPLVRYYLGRTKAKLGQGEEAIGEFRRAIELDPNNVSAYYALAHELRLQNRIDEWKSTLEHFNHLSQAGFSGVSASYQGQGKYAEASTDGGYTSIAETRPGVAIDFALPEETPAGAAGGKYVALVDREDDGLSDLVVGDPPRFHANRGGVFEPSSAWSFAVPPDLRGWSDALFGDVDGDGDADLVLSGKQTLVLSGDSQTGQYTEATLLGSASTSSLFADVDHDGDADLVLLEATGPRLMVNDGSGSFADATESAGLQSQGGARRVVASDFDRDRDLDLLVLTEGPGGPSFALYANARDGSFADVARGVGLGHAGAVDVALGDFEPDGSMDICSVTDEGVVRLHVSDGGRSYAARDIAAVPGGHVGGLAAADLDNDGDLDLLAFGTQGSHVLRRSDGQYELTQVGPAAPGPRRLALDDFDGDGDVDIWADGHLWRNATEGGGWLKVRLRGLNSNGDGFGAKIEIKTADRRQKRELRGTGRSPEVLTFGLSSEDSVEYVRILWPSGVRQTEIAASANQLLEISELNRKGTSCPILYAWDGEGFRFVSDFLGGAIIGYLVGEGEYYQPDTDEYLPLGELAPLDGRYVLQIANQLEEVIYLDALELIAVDHPPSVTVHPNERLLSSPPYPGFELFPVARLQPLRAARDHRGRDILDLLGKVDDDWYEGFETGDIHGYAGDHALTLDLGDLSDWSHPVLLAHGWVDYAHSTSNWAAAQRGLALYPPRLEVPDGSGGWRVAIEDMGCPAGLPKRMLVDLDGLLPAGDHRVRIASNTPVYWDQILVGEARDVNVTVHRRHFERADLHWRGYVEHTAIKGTFAFRYHYNRLLRHAHWGTHGGAYTRYGEVAALLDDIDDRSVIMGHGDELTVELDAASLPRPAEGMSRTFLFYADGFGKDMDHHSAHSLTVGPLPFHGMTSYPYPRDEHFPTTVALAEYRLDYNTRWMRGHYE